MSVQNPTLGEVRELTLHPAVKRMAEFMVANFPQRKCVAIANGLAQVAPLLFDQQLRAEIETLTLRPSWMQCEDVEDDAYLQE